MDFVTKATNWARFVATASLGAIHMGNTKNSRQLLRNFLPGGSNASSIYATGGAYYGIGLIHAGTNDQEIMTFLREALNRPGNNKEAVQHGIYLAMGLVAMATHDQGLYEEIREGIYSDDALIGEAAGYAVGLIMVGSKDENAIDDLMKYVHDTQHEKIIRAIAIALALIVYNAGEAADALIEQLSREKDPILRYGAMYCIGMAYCGSGNTAMLQKLIKFSVSDVSDDVRRAALINIGFLEIRSPDILFDNLKVLGLLSESYNSHVRFGAAMAIGIACAGSGKVKPYKVIEPLFVDPNYLVRQAALIASGLIFSQTTLKQEPGIKEFNDNLNKILEDKNEHLLIKFGAMISKGLVNLGGKNCVINLVSNTNENKMKSVIGMCLFTQYYYWFPMLHMLNLSVCPTFLFNLDDQLKIPKNYKMLSKAKPSIFGYPKEEEKDNKKKEVKAEAAVLSTHTRNKAKAKKTGTLSMVDINSSLKKKSSLELNPAPSGPIPNEDVDKKEEEVKIDMSKVEPEEEELENPIRILPLQKKFMAEIDTNDFEPIIHGRYSGFVMLKRKRPDVVSVYDEPEEKVEEKKEEEKKEEPNNVNNNANANINNQGYSSLPQEDFDVPEDFDVDKVK
jgi:26S proteasome regulatory subunit N2